MPEISAIKPTEVKLKEKPKFSYNTSAYDSYIQEGFSLPTRLPDRWEREFLSRVDLNQGGPIKVRILNMIRQRAIDYSTDKQDKKEYLVWTSDWISKNYQEVDIFVRSHIEGTHWQQRKTLVTKKNFETGEVQAEYEKGQPREVFTIPFNKKNVDEILYGEHPFGPDSINVTNLEDVKFIGKITGLGIMSFRCGGFTYEQFVNTSWKEFVELSTRVGGPSNTIRKPIPEKQRYIA